MTPEARTDATPADAATWWTVPEAAGYLKVSENAVYAAIRAGQLPVLHVGTQPRINPLALVQIALERVRSRAEPVLEAIVPAPTAAPTVPVTDRLRPKHIKTAAWRKTAPANGSGR
jgi:excisionase family DNA binding protein